MGDQDIYIKREQFDLSDPLEIQENEGITSEINDQVHGRFRDVTTGKCYLRPLRWWAESAPLGCNRVKVSGTLGATAVAPVAPMFTSLRFNPYSCPLCDKSISKSGNLQRHIESIHEGKKIFLDHERE